MKTAFDEVDVVRNPVAALAGEEEEPDRLPLNVAGEVREPRLREEVAVQLNPRWLDGPRAGLVVLVPIPIPDADHRHSLPSLLPPERRRR